MFSRGLDMDKGVILAENRESRVDTAIHMLFMQYDLAVIWLDKGLRVVDKVLAKKWYPFYFPKKPAKYVLELHPSQFSAYAIGDQLSFSDEG